MYMTAPGNKKSYVEEGDMKRHMRHGDGVDGTKAMRQGLDVRRCKEKGWMKMAIYGKIFALTHLSFFYPVLTDLS